MTMHMQINSPELRRQHEARKARMARLSRWSAYRRGDEDFDAHVLDWQEQQVRLQVRGSDADAHVMHWRRKMSYELERPSGVRLGRDANAHVATYRLFQLLGALDAVERVYVDDIIHLVCRFYNVTRADLLSQRRTANVVKPRQIAMYLAKTLTLRSLPEIGRRFGGRDHTTVLHALRKIGGLRKTDLELDADLTLLTATLKG